MKCILVFDIGKTHIKLVVLDTQLNVLESITTTNKVVISGDYPHADIDNIWQWFTSSVKQLSKKFNIHKISITTHGATAALVNTDSNSLVLPIMDYEFDGVGESQKLNKAYNSLRPSFENSYSPCLPVGLNLGKQLYWLEQKYPERFSQVNCILMYPQYWVWRLTNSKVSEVTSLGCHTDLWDVNNSKFSSLVEEQKWNALFPRIVPAWEEVAQISSECAGILGISNECSVVAGIHDSNASLVQHKLENADEPFTIISTGTWSILMASGVELSALDESKDMLANVDLTNKPIACARFMGGREYSIICQVTNSPLDVDFNQNDNVTLTQQYIDSLTMALPSFSHEGGPYRDVQSGLIGDIKPNTGAIIASLYCALMLDLQLDNLGSVGNIVIEGAFIKNPLICDFLAQLRPTQNIYISNDDTGTVMGAAKLCNWQDPIREPIKKTMCEASRYKNVNVYKQHWLKLMNERK